MSVMGKELRNFGPEFEWAVTPFNFYNFFRGDFTTLYFSNDLNKLSFLINRKILGSIYQFLANAWETFTYVKMFVEFGKIDFQFPCRVIDDNLIVRIWMNFSQNCNKSPVPLNYTSLTWFLLNNWLIWIWNITCPAVLAVAYGCGFFRQSGWFWIISSTILKVHKFFKQIQICK